MTSNDLQDALAQIKARAEKATEGPWDFEPDRTMQDGVYPAYVFTEHMAGYPICDVTTTPIPAGDEDATFIAHARADVPRLVAALEAVHNVVENYPLPHKRDDPTGEIACAIETFGDAIQDAYTDKLAGEGEAS